MVCLIQKYELYTGQEMRFGTTRAKTNLGLPLSKIADCVQKGLCPYASDDPRGRLPAAQAQAQQFDEWPEVNASRRR
jgi:hypothetical protein